MRNKEKRRFLIGTSGWSYAHWRGIFYPEQWPRRRWFEYYSGMFSTVEVNATFYRRFKDLTYHKWYDKAPEGFIYVLKAPRFITHRKYLLGVDKNIRAFSRSASLLRDKLGLILLQLSPRTPYDPERLQRAILTFGHPDRVAVEFRDTKWLTQETKDLLQQLGTTFCSADSPETPLLEWVTGKAAYIRLHGRKQWYSYNYSTEELEEIAALARQMAASGAQQVYIFFNNDTNGYAPVNALTLADILACPEVP
jgi:uncharacterized protein YecE (DUF72 family)